MKHYIHSLFFIGISILLIACDPKEKKYSNTPEISFISLSSDTIHYTDEAAAIVINIEFTDGDGDLAANNEGTDSTIYLIDSREGSVLPRIIFPMPYIPNENRQKNGGIKARTKITLQSNFFIPRMDDTALLKRDSLEYEIYIKDYGGRESNKITVGPIFMVP